VTIGSITVGLPGAKGSLTLSGQFNAFDLVGDERALVFALLDLMQNFEAKQKKSATPESVDEVVPVE
jgi:hypothetical protein